MNRWVPQSPAHEASPEQVAFREAEYDRICPRWRDARQGRVSFGWNVKDALFHINHEAHTAILVGRCFKETNSSPYLGINADIVPAWDGMESVDLAGRDLRLLHNPYIGNALYRIIG
jgi:hypothetical protein